MRIQSLILGVIIIITFFFANCANEDTSSKASTDSENLEQIYLTRGREVAQTTFATLSNNLQKAMQEGGVTNAVKYCNLSASPLVDSLENKYQASIRRTSLKTRNPNNQPSQIELNQLQAFQKKMDSGEKLKPVVQKIKGDQVAFYAPIHVMPLCQKCHGTIGETLLEEDYKVIQQLYPKDKAVGYVSGDLRGMWSITFPK